MLRFVMVLLIFAFTVWCLIEGLYLPALLIYLVFVFTLIEGKKYRHGDSWDGF